MFKRIKAGIAAISALVLTGTAASAGGLADEIVEAPVVVEDPVEAAPASSVPGWVIPVAILALVIGVVASSDNDDDDDDDVVDDDDDDGGKTKMQ
ncbi:hypothetical protein BC777_1435 [Yoonia maricola]|uniref:Secreted protein n=1 Tax=Yoonia maricola TaxID=420999 RepID=A0A2M8WNS0_9RHOB|nr:hypothetical protein [Yoonia maricola]PJI92580.1 hypothetical protein BC777_1435 [Yoonia maricola]